VQVARLLLFSVSLPGLPLETLLPGGRRRVRELRGVQGALRKAREVSFCLPASRRRIYVSRIWRSLFFRGRVSRCRLRRRQRKKSPARDQRYSCKRGQRQLQRQRRRRRRWLSASSL
jgi:hypothetical protein